MFKLKCFLVTLLLYCSVCAGKYAYVSWTGFAPEVVSTELYERIPLLYLARATYENKINETGWAYLELHTTQDASDDRLAFSAGYLEGYLTQELIWMHWQNLLKGFCHNRTEICALIDDYMDKNEKYISDMIQQNSNDSYWYQIKLYYIQLEGLASGYNAATICPDAKLTIRDLLWLNMMGDLDDLYQALTLDKGNPHQLLFGADHCTGLVKLLPDHSDLFTSQVTWNSYQSMLRFQKRYVLKYRTSPDNEEIIPGHQMSMSSYPGTLSSMDDFYIISTGLVAAETTLGNSNKSLYKFLSPVGQVSEFARSMVANRLSRNAHQWTRIFRKHNSGAYNNQWYILDYNKFTPKCGKSKSKIEPGLLWVLEQMPGFIEAQDLTQELVRTTYFPSYNIPYFPKVFNLSGGPERVRTYGDWFGYHTNPRAKILKEKQATICSLSDMYKVMRYNDYLHDPLSGCAECRPPYSACNAVAARNDLNPANGSYPFRALGHRSHGGTDAKITTYSLHKTYQFLAVSSPTYNITRGIPPFRWSEFDLGINISHIGHPDEWTFLPEIHRWEWENT